VERQCDNDNRKYYKYEKCIITYQPDTKSVPNPNPITKQHAIVNIQLNIVTCPACTDNSYDTILLHSLHYFRLSLSHTHMMFSSICSTEHSAEGKMKQGLQVQLWNFLLKCPSYCCFTHVEQSTTSRHFCTISIEFSSNRLKAYFACYCAL